MVEDVVTGGEEADASGFRRVGLERLRLALCRHIATGALPGFVAAVRHRGRTHVEAVGTQAYGDDIAMRQDTIFRLASMTKPITAVAAMILVEECRVRLDDVIDEWLPELANRRVLRTIESSLDDTVPAARPITVRDLLTFRSGYGELGFVAPTCALQRAMSGARLTLAEYPFTVTPDEFLKRLGSLPLAHQPGDRWLYHTAAEILGVLIARVSGQSLATFLRERIFEPLGMTDTGFYVPAAKLDRLPPCYGRDFASGNVVVLHEAHSGYYAQQPVFEAGGGGLVSTGNDLLAFGSMMLNKGAYGRERILSRVAVELMTTDQITPEQKARSPFFGGFWERCSWGLGLGLVTARRDVARGPGCFGWDGAFGTSWWVDPREQLVGVFLTQRRPDALDIPTSILDFWTSAYQLIDD